MSNLNNRQNITERQVKVFKTVMAAVTFEPQKFFALVCQTLAQELGVPRACFARLSENNNELQFFVNYTEQTRPFLGMRISLERNIEVAKALQERRVITVLDAAKEVPIGKLRDAFRYLGVRSALVVPIQTEQYMLGIFALDTPIERVFTPEEIEFVQSIANLAVPPMASARLIVQLQHELELKKRKTQRLSLSDFEAQSILGALPDTVYRLNDKAQILDVRAPNADASWMVDKFIHDIYPQAVADLIEKAVQKVQTKVQHLEYSLPYPTGERNIEARLAPIRPEGAVLIERDITEAKRAERDLNRSRAQYRDLVNNVSGIVWEAELHEKDYAQFTFVSPQSQNIIGVPREELLGSAQKWLEYIHPADRKLVMKSFIRAAEDQSVLEVEYRFVKPDGQVRWVQDRATGFQETGRLPFVRGLIVDITERKRAQILERGRNRVLEGIARGLKIDEVLEMILEMLTEQFEGLGAQISLIEEGQLQYVACRDVGNDLLECLDAAGGDPCSVAIKTREPQYIENLGADERWSLEYRAALIQAGYKRCAAHPIVTSTGMTFGTITSYTRVEHWGEELSKQQKAAADLAAIALERHNLIQKLEYQAMHDPLTGLPNRSLYHDRLEQAVARANRNGTLVSVLFIDLNGFKAINDTLGHTIGDSLLRDVGLRLSSYIRASDTVARLGGDEFCLILPDLIDTKSSERLRQEITQNLNIQFDTDQTIINVTASVGLAIYPRDGADADALYSHADTLMYHDKIGRKTKKTKPGKT